MTDPTPGPGLKPSSSTVGSGVGGALALIVISIIGAFHYNISPELAASITLICGTLAGYLPASGRS